MDSYKSEMYRGLLKEPEAFLRYAVADARAMLDVNSRFAAFVRHVQSDVLGMAETDLFDANSVPITIGRLVAETFGRWVLARAGADADAVKFCDRKLGVLDPDADKYVLSREVRHDLADRVRTPADLAALAADESGEEYLKAYNRASYHTTSLGGGGVRWFAGRPLTETAAFRWPRRSGCGRRSRAAASTTRLTCRTAGASDPGWTGSAARPGGPTAAGVGGLPRCPDSYGSRAPRSRPTPRRRNTSTGSGGLWIGMAAVAGPDDRRRGDRRGGYPHGPVRRPGRPPTAVLTITGFPSDAENDAFGCVGFGVGRPPGASRRSAGLPAGGVELTAAGRGSGPASPNLRRHAGPQRARSVCGPADFR